MKIFDKNSLKKWDQYTIENEPVSSLDLMKRAAKNLTDKIITLADTEQKIILLCGPGNNGGDGLCIALNLRNQFYRVEVWYFPITNPSEENKYFLEKVKNTEEIEFREITLNKIYPDCDPKAIIIDAIMGYGFKGPWKDGWSGVIKWINSLPNYKIAIDLPSGMNDDDIMDNVSVHVNRTLTIETPKRSFFYQNNDEKTGNWEIVPIDLHPKFYKETDTVFYSIDHNCIAPLIKPKPKFSQKWDFGHAALVVGSASMPGAALLSSKACLRTGPGLLSCFTPSKVATSLISFVPESMLNLTGETILDNDIEVGKGITGFGIGPGLGRDPKTVRSILNVLEKYSDIPKVIDADAINAIAGVGVDSKDFLKNSVLTPHHKEFERLFGSITNMPDMENKALDLATKHQCVIVLKGAYSRVCMPNGDLYYNTTGNQGMAKGGSGDVLTGMITGLLAQGYSLENAALVGVYLHGLAGDLAKNSKGLHSMMATDIIDQIANAFLFTSEK